MPRVTVTIKWISDVTNVFDLKTLKRLSINANKLERKEQNYRDNCLNMEKYLLRLGKSKTTILEVSTKLFKGS